MWWITQMWSLWSIASFPLQVPMNFFLIWWWNMFQSPCIEFWNTIAMLIKECPSSMWNFTCTRYAAYFLAIHKYIWFICSVSDIKSLLNACRFSGAWLISTLFPKFATEIWSLKIYWFVDMLLLCLCVYGVYLIRAFCTWWCEK